MKIASYKFCFLVVVQAISCISVLAQDIQFSQFYTANLYQNPAFAGAAHYSRVMAHSRIQWPTLNSNSGANGGKFFTYLGAYDTYIKNYKSGIAIMALRDEIGRNRINTTEIHAMYSYEVDLNNRFTFRPGLQLGLAQRNYDYQNLLFPIELDDNGLNGTNYNPNFGTSKLYPDASAGFLFYDNAFWVGYSAHHINMPNLATAGVTRLPVKHALTAGYKFILHTRTTLNYRTSAKSEFSITPTVHYKFQGKADQVDAGVFCIFDWFLAGLWYRGIPFKNYEKLKYINNESMIAQVGFRWDRWTVNYSYDFVVSKLGGIRQTGGAHELNITYTFKPHVRIGGNKPTKRLPCPDFEKQIFLEDGSQPSPGAGY
ncbi:MAG TPA: PorP/SprF family type IX secretion system membrane protein [Cytophagales bacterium]|nr:PorP/SprF family type IX secretion system membrane protein [Cytophagales bacterium]